MKNTGRAFAGIELLWLVVAVLFVFVGVRALRDVAGEAATTSLQVHHALARQRLGNITLAGVTAQSNEMVVALHR